MPELDPVERLRAALVIAKAVAKTEVLPGFELDVPTLFAERSVERPVPDLLLRRPRLAGALLLVLTGLLLTMNAQAESGRLFLGPPSGSYYRSAYLIGYPGALLGAWLLLLGWPEKSPLWWLLGTALVLLAGMAYGGYALQRAHPFF